MQNNDTSKTTMLVIATGFLGIYLIFSLEWAVWGSLIIGLTGSFSGWASRKIELIWMQIAKILSYIIPNILLAAIFFLILFPLSLLYRLFNKDPLMLKPGYDSFFIDIGKEMSKESFKKTW